jgi:prepilin-type N-terminal cleavage/methylation domain-containing protein
MISLAQFVTLKSPRQRCVGARERRGFTLVEVLMVVTAMAIIAGVIVPQVTSVIDDAKHSAMLAQLHELNVAIERFETDHSGQRPELLNHTLPQLVSSTNIQGTIGSTASHNLGPYIRIRIPKNPLNESSEVFRSNTAPPTNLDQRIGWVYHEETGQLWAGLHEGTVE